MNKEELIQGSTLLPRFLIDVFDLFKYGKLVQNLQLNESSTISSILILNRKILFKNCGKVYEPCNTSST